MNFTHPHFLIFLALFIVPYSFAKGKWKHIILLIASYIFYAYFSLDFCLLLFVSTLADFIIVKQMMPKNTLKSKKWVCLSIVFNLALLGIFKYKSFLWNDCLSPLFLILGHPLMEIEGGLPPVGISFFTFQTMSYSIDVYRGKINRSQSFLQFAVYVSMFPQLVAGPIVRAKDLLYQINEKIVVCKDDVIYGTERFVWGFLKKACIADSLAILLVDPAFSSPENQTPLRLCLAMVAYSFQIYFDFSGYSDMAIGIGRLIGFKFPENFSHPYQSKSFSEFWTRWHISLSSWLRDYLYISMGGNRNGLIRTLINLMITMLLGGLWHGASFLFVFWGFMHGCFLIIEKLWVMFVPSNVIKKTPSFVKTIFVFSCVTICWVPFRAQSSSDLEFFWMAPFYLNWYGLFDQLLSLKLDILILLGICIFSHFFRNRAQMFCRYDKWPFEFKSIFWACLLFFMVHYYPDSTQTIPFIYFRF